jgi:hypothetical protein
MDVPYFHAHNSPLNLHTYIFTLSSSDIEEIDTFDDV